jgi:hypothetical protein
VTIGDETRAARPRRRHRGAPPPRAADVAAELPRRPDDPRPGSREPHPGACGRAEPAFQNRHRPAA